MVEVRARTGYCRISAFQVVSKASATHSWSSRLLSVSESRHGPRHFPADREKRSQRVVERLAGWCILRPGFDTVEVWGSSPHGPTILFKTLAETLIRVRKGTTKDPAQLELCQSEPT